MEKIWLTFSLKKTWWLTGWFFVANLFEISYFWWRRPSQTFLLEAGFTVVACVGATLYQLRNKQRVGKPVSLGEMELSDYSTLEIILAFLTGVTGFAQQFSTSFIFGFIFFDYMILRRLVSYRAPQIQALRYISLLLVINLGWTIACFVWG